MSVYDVVRANHANCAVSRPSGHFGGGNRGDLLIYCHTCNVTLTTLDYCAGTTQTGDRCRKLVRPDLGARYCYQHRQQEQEVRRDSGR